MKRTNYIESRNMEKKVLFILQFLPEVYNTPEIYKWHPLDSKIIIVTTKLSHPSMRR